ncbi:DUF4326 domain-containing protein [Herbiconiux daphne]|uniref:DUF4326 domain-containing protein n=1 Tax=Herbiconiux daphne TaxID=2970914 RepID=A0ABT2H1J4_9MICO|nr:DUF4326 domain-containing protein [Herbiconiux daphne]MCS5733795.1 DUF4326 domain-containing protein [Herbiconiux daphne]
MGVTPHPVGTYGRVAAVGMFRLDAIQALGVEKIRPELAGKNLAWWCEADELCHADGLLDIANS